MCIFVKRRSHRIFLFAVQTLYKEFTFCFIIFIIITRLGKLSKLNSDVIHQHFKQPIVTFLIEGLTTSLSAKQLIVTSHINMADWSRGIYLTRKHVSFSDVGRVYVAL